MSEALTMINMKPAIRQPTSLDAYTPKTISEAMQLATWIAKSKMYAGIDSPEAAFAVMMRGAEMGIPLSVALTEIKPIKGRLSISSQLLESLAIGDPDVEYFRFVSSTTEKAVYAAKRRGDQEIVYEFAIEQAITAKLVNRGDDQSDNNWNKWRRVMLRRACVRELARIISPGRTVGLITHEEAEMMPAANASPPIVDGEVVPIVNAAKRAPAVVEAHAVESEETPEVKWARRLSAATNKKDGDVIAAEIQRAIPEKTDPIRMRLRGIYDSRVAAKWAVEPPHDLQTGEVLEPGANG